MKEREALKPKEVVKEKVEEAIVHEDEWGKWKQLIKRKQYDFYKILNCWTSLENTLTSSIHQFGCKSFEKQLTNILVKHIFTSIHWDIPVHVKVLLHNRIEFLHFNFTRIVTMHLPLLLTGIELVSETTEEELQQAQGDMPTLTQGVTVAYTKPAATKVHWERERAPYSTILFVIKFPPGLRYWGFCYFIFIGW